MNSPLEFLPAEQLARRLGGRKARKAGKGYVTCCAAHDDKDPSLSVADGDNGDVVVHCHAGCPQEAVIAALNRVGITLTSTRASGDPDATGNIAALLTRGWKLVETYPFTDEMGNVLYENVRLHLYDGCGKRVSKTFRQRRPDTSDGWIENLKGIQQVPYRLNELTAKLNQDVHICEGEKDADRLAKLGLLSTSIANQQAVDLSVFRDRTVYIHEDNDQAGRTKSAKHAEALHHVAATERIVCYPDVRDGEDVTDWLNAGHTFQDLLTRCEEAPEYSPKPMANGAGTPAHNRALPIIFGISANSEVRESLVKGLLPAVGTALIAGQFGMGKTTAVLDLAAAVIAGGTFAGLQVERPGGVLWIAAEGQHDLPSRLKVLESDKGLTVDRFARIEGCPALVHKDTGAILLATGQEAARQFKQRHGVELRLIAIDTVAAAAGWTDENSAAECQRVMNLLATLAGELQCCVAGVDHLGKVADQGTRGNSAKEAAADVVLAILGDRDATGMVRNLQLTTRKNRCGPTGLKIPFALRPVQLQGEDCACVVDWARAQVRAETNRSQWPKSLAQFRAALNNALATDGKRIRPWLDGPEVVAVDINLVRREYSKLYVATGETEKQRSDARRQAFHRNTRTAQQDKLIGAAENDGIQWIWLASVTAGNGAVT